MRTTFFFIFLLSVTTSCCLKKNKEHVPESFKQYFSFKEGSYWVYKNQFDAYDTLTVVDFYSEIKGIKGQFCDFCEDIVIEYLSSDMGTVKLATRYYYDIFIICNDYSFPYFTELTDFAKNYNNENILSCCISDIEWWIEDSLQVNNKYYHNVVANKTTSDISADIPKYPLICYFKDNIGLVKRELANGEVWELIEYSVKRK